MKRLFCLSLIIVILVGFAGCGFGSLVSPKNTDAPLATETPGNTEPISTEAPTLAPTEEPTVCPTETVLPTETPAPTEEPTAVPTEVPTPTPTEVPTVAPTLVPTVKPTVVPTVKPTPVHTPIITAPPTATPVPKSGVFAVNSAQDRYSLSKKFPETPKTFEARFECNANVTACGEIIAGNYKDTFSPGMYFGIDKDGYPTLYVNYDSSNREVFTLSEYVLQNGRHDVAFSVFDGEVLGYLDGKMLLQKPYPSEFPLFTDSAFSILGDDTANNSYWFKNGEILKLNIYSAPRTVEQIAADFSETDTEDGTLLVSFDFGVAKEDRSKNGNNIVPYWFDGEYVAKDSYKYTIAVIGDIQTLMFNNYNQVPKIFDYILNKKDAFNIKRAIFLGDLTEYNSSDEWTFVRSQVERLDGQIPYSLVRGNHDGFIGEYHDLAAFNRYFGGEESPYFAQYDGCFNGKINNTYRLCEIEGVNYLFLNLDFGPTDAVLEWANEICGKYSDRTVIISLHSFLFCDGTLVDLLEPQEKYAVKYNSSSGIWDKLVANHANISMIIGGHTPNNNILVKTFTGKNGNTVTAILSDSQYVDKYMGDNGIVTLLHFAEDGKLVSLETFSSVKDKFYKADNQILFN